MGAACMPEALNFCLLGGLAQPEMAQPEIPNELFKWHNPTAALN